VSFQTQIDLQTQSHHHIDYASKVLLLGSCFAENIADKFSYFKFQQLQNPFGILFHVSGIETLLTNAINGEQYDEKDIFFHNEQWHCFDAHSKLSNPSKEQLLTSLNDNLMSTRQYLETASHVIITLGTAWVYRFIETDTHVANCHKIPQKKFLKELMLVDELRNALQAIVSLIKSVNSKTSILFTVSPVRHIKDGFVENNRSKAHLLTAIHDIVEPRENVHYFPSYEIMMDELRDYRFYESDMLHPNSTAISHIWEKFQKVWISKDSAKTMLEVDTVQKGMLHRPFNSKSEAHQQFLQKLEVKKEQLQSLFPNILF